jgi:hypothetical protein
MTSVTDQIREPAWRFDPTSLSLEVSTERQRQGQLSSSPFCAEVGRRLLAHQLQSSDWILRRVEKLDMSGMEGVRRDITLELLVPEDAPVFVDADGREVWCVPLSLMRRRTLVGLDIRDERGQSVSLPGIRLTQQLDQALLLAAACSPDGPDPDGRLLDWITRSVAGRRDVVRDAYSELDTAGRDHFLGSLREDPLFLHTARRLQHNFTLYLFLDKEDRRHRLIHLSFQEPSDWRYQKPKLTYSPDGRPPDGQHPAEARYEVGVPRWSLRGSFARLGLVPQRIRFQVPGAESAASFHCELSAPPGVRVVRATLLAGRPNEARAPSFDEVRGHAPTVALHAVEVPPGSLCRVQADLCLSARGALATMMVANIAMVLLLGVVVTHASPDRAMDSGEVTNVILFLVSAVAAAAALVAQGAIGGLPARFISGVRVLTTLALAFPVVAAVFLTFDGHASSLTSVSTTYYILCGLFVASIVIGLLTFGAWLNSWGRERTQLVRESPWDMTRFDHPVGRWARLRARARRGPTGEPDVSTFDRVLRRASFHRSAVGVASAEGWHSVYDWDDRKQHDALMALEDRLWLDLRAGAGRAQCHGYPTVCARRHHRCPSAVSAGTKPADA